MKLDSSYAISRYITDISRLAVRNLAPKVQAANMATAATDLPIASVWDRVDRSGKERIFTEIEARLHEICWREGGK